MQTKLAPQYINSVKGKIADGILRSCVHCGFCSATCPTYLNTGNELNSPRGRIYIIKNLLEGHTPSEISLQHLNLCLQCRNCESTCPSGVEYGKLYEIGQDILQESTPNNLITRLKYFFFANTLPYPKRFTLIFLMFRLSKPVLPAFIKKKFKTPRSVNLLSLKNDRGLQAEQDKDLQESVILFKGCIQRILAPEINQSVENLLTKTNTTAIHCNKEQCCGAIDWHAGRKQAAMSKMKANIDMWHKEAKPLLITASGCSAFIKQYHEHLEDNKDYANKAKALLTKTFDTVDYFNLEKLRQLQVKPKGEKIACHTPCTLQHWQKNPLTLKSNLESLGFNLVTVKNEHLCCGSAGLYSAMNPVLSEKIKLNKVNDLMTDKPNRVVSNNIGCINHLESELNIPIQHWCELIDKCS